MRSFGRYELTVIQCDAKIQNVEIFSEANPVPDDRKWNVYGCGGTDFRPVFDHVKTMPEPPELLIYLTDGEGPAPDQAPKYPVLWLITSGGNPPCAWGKKIFFK